MILHEHVLDIKIRTRHNRARDRARMLKMKIYAILFSIFLHTYSTAQESVMYACIKDSCYTINSINELNNKVVDYLKLSDFAKLPDLSKIKTIRNLDIYGLQNERIPDEIWEIDMIETLIIQHSYIKYFEGNFSKFSNLRVLEMFHCEIKSVNHQSLQLPRGLKELNLSNNPIDSFDLAVVNELKLLETFAIYQSPNFPVLRPRQIENILNSHPNCILWLGGNPISGKDKIQD